MIGCEVFGRRGSILYPNLLIGEQGLRWIGIEQDGSYLLRDTEVL